MTERAVDVAFTAEAVVGEGPCWHDGTLVWVDLFDGILHLSDRRTGADEAYAVGGVLGAAVPRRHGGFAAITQDGFATIDDGVLTTAADVVADPLLRMNDGKCDRRGRFWAGSCAYTQDSPVGSLFVWAPDEPARLADDGFVLPNGLGWSPDDRRFYLVDSKERSLYAYDFDLERGEVAHRRELCRFEVADGLPDGLAVDAEDTIWIACFAGAQVIRVSSEGRVIERVHTPVSKPTSCAFGEGNELYVTSARLDLSADQLAAEPLAGSFGARARRRCRRYAGGPVALITCSAGPATVTPSR